MNDKNEIAKQRRLARIAAGECGKCGEPREPPTRGGATATLCTACAQKHYAAAERLRKANVSKGKCCECGKRRERKKRGGATAYRCAACAIKERARENARIRKRVGAGNCNDCNKPREPKTPGGATAFLCVACARKHRVIVARHCRKKRLARKPAFGPPPTGEPRYVGRGAKPLGPSAAIRFLINRPTLEAINTLKRRYTETHNGSSWRDHVAEILRDAVVSVLKKGGPVPVERERMCVRGWYCTLRFPIAHYRQITHIANQRFDTSRAMTVRVALRQAVNPPFVIATGGKRVPGGKPRDPWDED